MRNAAQLNVLARPHEGQRSRLVELRRYFQLTQIQFGHWLGGYSQANVSQWETGLRPMPYTEVASTFGVSVDWLMGLSSFMWGPTVRDVKEKVHQHLISMSPEREQELSSLMVEPADRVRVVVTFCQEQASHLFTDRYLAAVMLLDSHSLLEVMRGDAYAERSSYARLAEFLELPVTWFEFGDTSELRDSRFEPYRSVVADAIAHGISPERLAQLVSIMVQPIK